MSSHFPFFLKKKHFIMILFLCFKAFQLQVRKYKQKAISPKHINIVQFLGIQTTQALICCHRLRQVFFLLSLDQKTCKIYEMKPAHELNLENSENFVGPWQCQNCCLCCVYICDKKTDTCFQLQMRDRNYDMTIDNSIQTQRIFSLQFKQKL